MVDFDKTPEADKTDGFGEPFDYDPTAEASLSEQPGTSDSASNSSSSGPGWDTYAGVGNGPGWGEMPSYPAPLDSTTNLSAGPNPTESYPLPGYPVDADGTQAYPTAFGQQTPSADSGGWNPAVSGQVQPQQQHYPAAQYPQNQYPSAQYPQNQYPPAQYPNAQYPQPPYTQSPFPQGQQYPPGQYSPPGYGYPPAPVHVHFAGGNDAPFGRDPITGQPLSDKSKVAAGLLQIFLGGFGAGRFYIGSNGIAVAQLLLLVFGWLTVFFGVGALVLLGLGVWVVIDGIMMLVGSVKDGHGRTLRN
nr:TM2 domain-containing protein [Rhodococcus sp. (in: high G+C Gram-positive bacteria)]